MKKTVNKIFSLLMALIFILVFAALLFVIWNYALKNFSLASVIAGILSSIIPGLLLYGGISATIDFIKDNFSS